MCEELSSGSIDEKMVKEMVDNCEKCTRIDPAVRFCWRSGTLTPTSPWERWYCDITHVTNMPFLTIIDGFTKLTMWFHFKNESPKEICLNLLNLFSILGPPNSILTDKRSLIYARIGKLNWNHLALIDHKEMA